MARTLQEKERNFTVFDEETDFDGVLEFTDDLVIAGKFSGTINATGNLEIAKTAICVTDEVKVESLVVSGTLRGNIEAKDKVAVLSGGSVTGNVVASRLLIEENVQFDGEVTMARSAPPTDIFSLNAKELKKSLNETTLPNDSNEEGIEK